MTNLMLSLSWYL